MDESQREIAIPVAWRPIVEGCCELKEAIDFASRWPISTQWGSEVKKILASHHLLISDIPKHSDLAANFPDHFACLLGGKSIFRLQRATSNAVQRTALPGWATLGWVRKDDYAATPTLGQQELMRALEKLPPDATTDVIAGIPLFMAGEGKNRTQIQRLSGARRETYLRVHERPNVALLTARPLAFAPGIVVLESGRGYELLPFRTASEPLLRAIGVNWVDTPCYRPWLGRALALGKPWMRGPIEKRVRLGLLKGA